MFHKVKCQRLVALILFILSAYITTFSQQSKGGYPLGLLEQYKSLFKGQDNPYYSILGHSESEKKNLEASFQGSPLFAAPVPLISNPTKNGKWYQLDNQRWVWRLTLQIENHQSILIQYKDFNLPKEALLFVYNQENKKVLGAYTHQNNQEEEAFITGMIKGPEVTIEYITPVGGSKNLAFDIDRILMTWEDEVFGDNSVMIDTGFNASYPCHININCPEGAGLTDQKRAVVRVMMVLEEGVGWCTGTLMNNTAEDRIPYVLSAFHCRHGYTPIYNLWRFDFQYESATCENPAQEPTKKSILGCTEIAGKLESDFLLLRLNNNVPADYNPYYMGWDRQSDYTPTPVKLIHHPNGDIKKVSVESNDLAVHAGTVIWDNDTSTPPNTHYRSDLDSGTHEPGSSGSPLVDPNGRLIAQLHGGVTDGEDCTMARAYLGMFTVSWDSGDTPESRLSNWLDPSQTGMMTLAGINADMNAVFSVDGTINSLSNQRISNVIIRDKTNGSMLGISDENGNFRIDDLAIDQSYELEFELVSSAAMGISAVDLVLIRNHILATSPFGIEAQIKAADANNNGSVSAVDMIQIQNVLLGLWTSFPNVDPWGFLPDLVSITANQAGQVLQIQAYKIGDVNGSAKP